MFKLYFTNIPDRGLVSEHATLEGAKAAGKKHGFEFTVMSAGHVVGASSTFGGWKDFPRQCDAERFGDSCVVCTP